MKGSLLGVIYWVGSRRTPVGYLVTAFQKHVEVGYSTKSINKFFIRLNVGRRDVGGNILAVLSRSFEDLDIRVVKLDVD
ncbi:hypothetical protein ACMAZE_08585 [Pseudopelagicola sp. nBUS_20]|uniref:hypothetical protein n=1 Tax=Pseudopelagicola sp. nBUS_20 TaxID=3395317 RepID=UPI003EBF8C69